MAVIVLIGYVQEKPRSHWKALSSMVVTRGGMPVIDVPGGNQGIKSRYLLAGSHNLQIEEALDQRWSRSKSAWLRVGDIAKPAKRGRRWYCSNWATTTDVGDNPAISLLQQMDNIKHLCLPLATCRELLLALTKSGRCLPGDYFHHLFPGVKKGNQGKLALVMIEGTPDDDR